MKKLIEALHVIQEECKKHDTCYTCPLEKKGCSIKEPYKYPENWKINDDDKIQKALL